MTEAKPSIKVTQATLPPLQEYINEISPLWESHWITNMGAKHKQLEKDLKKYLGAQNISLYVNGHSALEGIIEGLDLGSDGRKKVITTPFTFASTTHAIKRKGLEPVFADIKPTDFTLDPKSIESVMSDDVCAILPVHVYGNVCDVDSIQDIASKHDLRVIYDAAHAFGVKKDGEFISRFGDASVFSFHATKVFNTIEGGAICYGDPSLTDTLNQWKNFGITGEDSVQYVGGNAKMNEFSAAMGICNLRHIDENIAKRQLLAKLYWSELSDVAGISYFRPPENIEHNYSYLPILVDEDAYPLSRDQLYSLLKENGYNSRKYFFPLISDYECYEGEFDSSATPIASRISSSILSLPIYPSLEASDVNRICEIIRNAHA